MFYIRELEPKDLDFIEDLRQRNLLTSAPEFRLADLSDDEKIERMDNWHSEKIGLLQELPISRTFVATDEIDRPIGFAIVVGMAKDDFRPERQGFLCDLAVEDAYWGKGVGELLIEACENYIRRIGHDFMMLNVSAFNDRAIEFYKKMGYVSEWLMMGKRIK